MIRVLQHPSGDRRHAEQLEVGTIDDLGVHELRLAGAVGDEAVRQPGGHAVVRLRAIPPVEEIGKRRAAALDALALDRAEDLDETIGVGVRERPEQHRVEQPENRRRRPDAKGERQDGADGGGRAFPDGTPGVAQIGCHEVTSRRPRGASKVPACLLTQFLRNPKVFVLVGVTGAPPAFAREENLSANGRPRG